MRIRDISTRKNYAFFQQKNDTISTALDQAVADNHTRHSDYIRAAVVDKLRRDGYLQAPQPHIMRMDG